MGKPCKKTLYFGFSCSYLKNQLGELPFLLLKSDQKAKMKLLAKFKKTSLQRLTQTNTYRAFYLSTHPSEKLVFALSGTRTHVSLITSRAC